MPSTHLSIKSGKAGKGAGHAAYIGGGGKYEREDVVCVLDRNLPTWAKDGVDFFAAADKLERANGRAYSEVEAAIPRAVADPVAYAKEYAEKLLGTAHPYRLAVHDKPAKDGGRNIHMHLMFSERKLDGIEREREQFFKRAAAPYRDRKTKEMMPADPSKGGAGKDRKWNDRAHIQTIRDGWQAFAKAHGIDLDLRSNHAKGVGAPEPKVGPEHPRAGENPAREIRLAEMERLREVRVIKIELHELNKQEKQHARTSSDNARHHQPATAIAEMRDVWGVNNVHDIGGPENVLQQNAPGDLRPQQAETDFARLHELATVRAVAQAKAVIAAKAAQERAKAIADVKAQARAERKAAWLERGQRRRSGTPNRVIRLDQSVQSGRTMYSWGGSGPSAGKVAVIQKGNQLSTAGRYSASKVAAMAQIANSNGWQSVRLTGDDAFKALALPEFLKRGIAVSNPELQPQVQAIALVKQQAIAQAQARAEALAAEAHQKAVEKYLVERKARDAVRQAATEVKAKAAVEQQQVEALANAQVAAKAKLDHQASQARWVILHAERAERDALRVAAEIARKADLNAMLRGEPLPSVLKAQAEATAQAEAKAQEAAQVEVETRRAALEQAARRSVGAKLPEVGARLPSPGKGRGGR